MATIETAPQGADPRADVMPRALVIVGGGEHARVIADAARTQPDRWRLAGFTDPAGAGTGGARALGLDHLGADEAYAASLADTAPADRPALILGFGGAAAARRGPVAVFDPGATWATVVHATAWVSPSALLGPGVVVLAGAAVNAGARVDAHAIVNTHAVVEHDVHVGAGAHIGPGAVVGGGTTIGEDTLIGLGASVRDHIAIGARAVVGMGAVVVADVPDGATVLGVPARIQGAGGG